MKRWRTLKANTPFSQKKLFDIFILITYFISLSIALFFFRPGHVLGTLLFFALPALYLIFRYWHIHSHTFLFSIAVGIATGLPLQIVAELNDVWTYDPSFASFKIGELQLEAIGWYILWKIRIYAFSTLGLL